MEGLIEGLMEGLINFIVGIDPTPNTLLVSACPLLYAPNDQN